MIPFVTSNAIAMTYVVKELTLEFAGDVLPVNSGSQVRSFQSRRERGGEFMGGACRRSLVCLRSLLFICAGIEFALVIFVILLVARILGVRFD